MRDFLILSWTLTKCILFVVLMCAAFALTSRARAQTYDPTALAIYLQMQQAQQNLLLQLQQQAWVRQQQFAYQQWAPQAPQIGTAPALCWRQGYYIYCR